MPFVSVFHLKEYFIGLPIPWICLQNLWAFPSKNREAVVNRKYSALLFKQDDWKFKVFPLFVLLRRKAFAWLMCCLWEGAHL